jgi:catechol 2,3-dioxygenase-like lactoylglutathione lyase family enzyme
MHDYITGIQQIGIGVKKLRESNLFYKDIFGLDVLIFDDTSDAHLMTQYTGNKVYNRQAVLTMNLAGGGGFEIWQYNNREPKKSEVQIKYGDVGICAAKIKCFDIQETHTFLSSKKNLLISPIQNDPVKASHFWVKDYIGNSFNLIQGDQWFKNSDSKTGGVAGAVIGVSNIENALPFYRNFIGIHEIIFDVTGNYLDNYEGVKIYCRRVLLKKKVTGCGAFSKLLGTVEIELVQRLDGKAVKIFKDRFWGDCGFIHLCFDVLNMDGLKKHADSLGIKFTVDSHESFAMDNASGRFCYTEDPDGTLIELVETHKIPLLKKLGLYLNVKKRKRKKPLPDWMINLLSLSKVK